MENRQENFDDQHFGGEELMILEINEQINQAE